MKNTFILYAVIGFLIINGIKIFNKELFTIQASETFSTIELTGTTNIKYAPKLPNDTLIDATRWTSTAVGPSPSGTTSRAVDIYGNDANTFVANSVWRGGIIKGSIPTSWDWTTTHNFGGAGITTYNDGPATWEYLRVHNVEDAVRTREDGLNQGTWFVHDSYFTAIRDDAVENDSFEPGTMENCLFDGIYTFYSEQEQGNLPIDNLIGANEDRNVYMKRIYVRSYPTNNNPDVTSNRYIGPWFKLQGAVPHHKVTVTDSVFAIGPVSSDFSWSNVSTPADVTWSGTNNFILWLGTVGGYKGTKPAGVTFMEGTAAENKWVQVRNAWLTSHGLPAQNFAANYNPHDAPIAQIPPSPATPKPGDANGDNTVNYHDYTIWSSHYGQHTGGVINGDFDLNSLIDGKDYLVWMINYGL